MFNKKAIFFKVIGIIFLVGLTVSVSAFVYFYNYHNFKTLRICITEELETTEVSCITKQDCVEEIYNADPGFLTEAPEFLVRKLDEAIQKGVSCQEFCMHKTTYSNFYGEDVRDFESCQENEEEVSIDIHGKEGIQLLLYLKKVNQED